jgi:predicted Mrr-cat superfamily restriction endonuclease
MPYTKPNPHPDLWAIWAGRDDDTTEDYDLSHETTSILWDNVPDLSGVPTWNALRPICGCAAPNRSRDQITGDMLSIWPFYAEVEPGDWVYLPMRYPEDRDKREFSLGVVKSLPNGGGYHYDPKRPSGWHYRGCLWVYKRLPERLLKDAGFAPFDVFHKSKTVTPITPAEFPGGVRSLLDAIAVYQSQKESVRVR